MLSPSTTRLDFANEVKPEVAFNILNYPYFYNGGGVAVGDLNGDELPDLYFTANQGPNRLFLNRGDFTFEDVTAAAGVAGQGDWSTGVSLVDINADGRLDIYVSNVSGLLGQTGSNELFINLGAAKFKEVAEEWGLAQSGYATQSSFFDYDGDGDLDCFQLNHSIRPSETVGLASERNTPDALAGNRMLRNEGSSFVDVSSEAGIYRSRLG
ncbi:MAG: VCBS repeat-containing protein, partial [Bacteroidota bacterium]